MSHAIVVQKAMAHDIEEGKCHAGARVIAAGLGLYPKLNMRTVLQRISAALIFSVAHRAPQDIRLAEKRFQGGQWVLFGAIMACQMLFYATFATHVATSFSKALITLGWFGSRERQAAIDRVVYVLCAVVFVVAAVAVVRGWPNALFGKTTGSTQCDGMCGSCSMVINGVPALACEAFLADLACDELTIRPCKSSPSSTTCRWTAPPSTRTSGRPTCTSASISPRATVTTSTSMLRPSA